MIETIQKLLINAGAPDDAYAYDRAKIVGTILAPTGALATGVNPGHVRIVHEVLAKNIPEFGEERPNRVFEKKLDMQFISRGVGAALAGHLIGGRYHGDRAIQEAVKVVSEGYQQFKALQETTKPLQF